MKIIKNYIVQIHLCLHLVPIMYFAIEFFYKPKLSINNYFVLPMALFFLSGFACWKIHHKYFYRKIYKLYMIGNFQMLIYFPIAALFDYIGWPPSENSYFGGIANIYFIFHTLFSSFTIPIMLKDWRSHIND